MGRRLRRVLLCFGLLVVVLGAALHVGAVSPGVSVAMPDDPSALVVSSISSVPDAVIGAIGPVVRSRHLTRFAGPDRAVALLGVVALSLVVAGAAWARGLVALPVERRRLATVAVPAAPRGPPRSA